MPASLTTASAILKEIYEPRIRAQLNEEAKALKRIERTSEGTGTDDLGGKYVVFPIHTTRNAGIGSRNENEALPTPGNQGYERAQVSLSYAYGRVRLTGQAIKLASSKPQAFASVLDQEMTGIKNDLTKDDNRQVYGTAKGTMATATSGGSTTQFNTTNTQYIEPGQVIDIYASDGTTVRVAAVTVTAVVKNTSVTFTPAAGGATQTGDTIHRQGSINREMIGFESIVSDTGTLYNVNPSSVPLWKSVVDANGGVNRSLSESLMISVSDQVYNNGGKVTVGFTTRGVRRAYYNLLVQQRQFANTKEFAGGFTGLAFFTDDGEIPIVADIDCPPNRMYFINENELKLYREGDWSFMDMDGSKWDRVAGFDAYDATLFQYRQLGTHRRNSHAVIRDITES